MPDARPALELLSYVSTKNLMSFETEIAQLRCPPHPPTVSLEASRSRLCSHMTLALSLVIPDKALHLVSAHLMRLDVLNEMEKKKKD